MGHIVHGHVESQILLLELLGFFLLCPRLHEDLVILDHSDEKECKRRDCDNGQDGYADDVCSRSPPIGEHFDHRLADRYHDWVAVEAMGRNHADFARSPPLAHTYAVAGGGRERKCGCAWKTTLGIRVNPNTRKHRAIQAKKTYSAIGFEGDFV